MVGLGEGLLQALVSGGKAYTSGIAEQEQQRGQSLQDILSFASKEKIKNQFDTSNILGPKEVADLKIKGTFTTQQAPGSSLIQTYLGPRYWAPKKEKSLAEKIAEIEGLGTGLELSTVSATGKPSFARERKAATGPSNKQLRASAIANLKNNMGFKWQRLPAGEQEGLIQQEIKRIQGSGTGGASSSVAETVSDEGEFIW